MIYIGKVLFLMKKSMVFWGAAAGLSELLRGPKTGQPLPGSSSSRRSAAPGPAAVSDLAG